MNLKIFKLRSGEELICQVVEETKTKIKIINPLIFKLSTVLDENGSYDMTVLRDWLSNTTDKTAILPKNHIVMQHEPKQDTIKLYELQLESEKSLKEEIVSRDTDSVKQENFDSMMASQEQIMTDFLNSLFSDYVPQNINKSDTNNPFEFNKPKRKRKNNKNFNLPSPEMNPEEVHNHGIYISMMLPAEAIMNLITAGLLNPEDLLAMIKEIKKKNRFTGDEKNRSDFGNKFSDWNPDPDSQEYK
jgi:uncharacterized protein YfkK (UPF0435 family)